MSNTDQSNKLTDRTDNEFGFLSGVRTEWTHRTYYGKLQFLFSLPLLVVFIVLLSVGYFGIELIQRINRTESRYTPNVYKKGDDE